MAANPKDDKITVKVGQRVKVIGKDVSGTVRYIGVTHFAAGKWIGVELDEPKGKNNGSVTGKAYFKCNPDFGMFVRQSQVEAEDESTPAPPLPAPTQIPSTPSAPRNPPSTASSQDSTPLSVTKQTSKPEEERVAPTPRKEEVVQTPVKAQPPAPLATVNAEKMSNMSGELASLTEKLAAEQARVQDLLKFKAQYEQLAEYKVKWIEKYEGLSRRNEALEKEHRELKEKYESETIVLSQAAEMATLDKEMSEEKNAELELRVNELSDLLEEAKLELEIIKAERGDEGEGGSNSNGGGTSYGGDITKAAPYIELQTQTARLKDALIKLRDQNQQITLERDSFKAQVNELQASLAASKKSLDSKTRMLDDKSKELASVLEQVDAATGAESMVEKLTEKNLALEEKIRALSETVSDLTALTDMNEEIEQTQAENEKLHKNLLIQAENKLVEKEHELLALEETVFRHEDTIASLNETLRALKEELSSLPLGQSNPSSSSPVKGSNESPSHSAPRSPSPPSRDRDTSYIHGSPVKARVKPFEAELKALDAEQADLHIKMLKSFLPETFSSSDYQVLRLTLLMGRVSTKALLVADHARKHFKLAEDMSLLLSDNGEFTIEQLSVASSLVSLLTALASEAASFKRALNYSEEAKTNLGSIVASYAELSTHEGALDQLLGKVASLGYDLNMPLAELKAAVSSFRKLGMAHFGASFFGPATHHVVGTGEKLLSLCDVIDLELRQVTSKMAVDDSSPSSAALGQLAGRLSALRSQIKDIRGFARKLSKMGDSGNTKMAIALEASAMTSLNDAYVTLFELAAGLRLLTTDVINFLRTSSASQTLDVATVTQMAEAHRLDLSLPLPSSETSAPTPAPSSSGDVLVRVFEAVPSHTRFLNKLVDGLSAGQHDVPVSSLPQVEELWVVRAKQMRDDITQSLGLTQQLEAKKTEIHDLKIAVKLKERELEEQKVALQTSNRRLEVEKTTWGDRLGSLQTERDDLKQKLVNESQMYEKTIRTLEDDLKTVEAERNDLKKKGDTRRQFGGKLNAADDFRYQAYITMLQDTVYHMRKEVARVRAMKRPIFEPLALPTYLSSTQASSSSSSSTTNSSSNSKSSFFSLVQETNKLALDAQLKSAAPLVVDISTRNTEKPGITPTVQVRNANFACEALRSKGHHLASMINDALVDERPALRSSTRFSSFLRPSFVRMLHEAELKASTNKVGTIRIPSSPSSASTTSSNTDGAKRTVKVAINVEGLNHLHSLLVS